MTVGTNGKMNEAQAAMGLTSLESFDESVAINRRNHAAYERALSGLPGIRLLTYDPAEAQNFQYVVLEIDPESAGLSRDQLHAILWAENVFARRYFHPGCHRMEPYRSLFPGAGKELPNTEALTHRVLCLPTGTTVGKQAIATMGAIIRLAVAQSAAIVPRLPGFPERTGLSVPVVQAM